MKLAENVSSTKNIAQKTKRLFSVYDYLTEKKYPDGASKDVKRAIRKKAQRYNCIALTLYDKVCAKELYIILHLADVQVGSCQCSLMVLCSFAISTGF